jgi:pyridoxine kinase
MTKKILTMQDLSCVGQCSLTVALPLLSAYGVEAAVLPTAVLSNHTMFKSWSYLDLTPEIENIYANWQTNDIKFDGFLLGYLGKQSLMDLAEKCFDTFANGNAPKIIDPAFGDNGKLYGGFDEAYVKAMAHLLRRADIILPNITEASFLTGEEYKDVYDKAYVEKLVKALTKVTSGIIIITGIELDGKIGEVIFANGKFEYVMLEKLPTRKHGTGDIFAAVFAAEYLNGKTLADCCLSAGKFVADSIRATGAEHFYGVNFEAVLDSGRAGK